MRKVIRRLDNLIPKGSPFYPSVTRSASNWVSLATSNSSMFERRRALAQWLIANGIWTPGPEASIQPRTPKGGRWTRGCFNSPEVFERADITIERIRSGELDPFDSANRMVDFLREHNKAVSTIFTARSSLIGFLRYSRLGLDPEDIRLAVKKFRRVRVLASKLPTRDQVRGLLLVAPL